MAASPADFPDPLDRSDPLPLDNADDLISQLAGEEIARLLAPDANWEPAEVSPAAAAAPELKPTPARQEETPVEELAAQLDQLFEEIRQGKPVDPPAQQPPQPASSFSASPPRREAAIVLEPEPDLRQIYEAEPVLVMRRRPDDSAEESLRDEPRQTLIAPLEEDPLPAVLRPLAWLNSPVMDLGGRARLAVSVVSLLTFVGSVSALVYVIMLRQQQG